MSLYFPLAIARTLIYSLLDVCKERGTYTKTVMVNNSTIDNLYITAYNVIVTPRNYQ
jgi:hypothetical protein